MTEQDEPLTGWRMALIWAFFIVGSVAFVTAVASGLGLLLARIFF